MVRPFPQGITALVIKAVIIERHGPRMNKNLFDTSGIISSFMNILTPSATGCNIPKIPALFGPKRSCMNAATFLSA